MNEARSKTTRYSKALLGRAIMALLIGSSLSACEDERIDMDRPDSGAGLTDAGVGGPLMLEVGMMFSYQATLTFRDQNGDERSAAYSLNYTITAADDQGPASTITVTASGQRDFDQNWVQAAGADSWVARVGPTEIDDVVSAALLTVDLSDGPQAPPIRKSLPVDALFFLDLRQEEAIRTEWQNVHADMSPQAVGPDQHPAGRWMLGLSGTDEDMIAYPSGSKLRAETLEYDPRGFLVRADERLGDSGMRPNGSFTLSLTSGPM